MTLTHPTGALWTGAPPSPGGAVPTRYPDSAMLSPDQTGEPAMQDVVQGFARAVDELGRVAERLDARQIDGFIAAIATAKRVFLIGAGREGLSTRAFTMRLMHLGKEAHWIWDDTTPGIGAGDLLIATSGSGAIGHIDYVFDQAVAAGADTAVV